MKINADDLPAVIKAVEYLDKMRGIDGLTVEEMSAVVLDSTGTYTVGTVWFDSEDERFKVDFSKYGEA